MPIRTADKNRYPHNWKILREIIMHRAGGYCEDCGAENYSRVVYLPGEKSLHRESIWTDEEEREARAMGYRVARIVLSIAHLDNTPENCDLDNLKALCQRCHLRRDAILHARHSAETRAASPTRIL